MITVMMGNQKNLERITVIMGIQYTYSTFLDTFILATLLSKKLLFTNKKPVFGVHRHVQERCDFRDDCSLFVELFFTFIHRLITIQIKH